jgi:phage terminase small subunit
MTELQPAPPAPVRKRHRKQKYSGEPLVGEIDERGLGPAMAALTEKQRRFVLELWHGPVGYGSAVRAARAAGYSGNKPTLCVRATQLLQSASVQAALREIGGKHIRIEAFEAIKTTAQIARDINHKDCLKAALALLDRGGFAAETHHTITVEHVDHDAEAVGELRTLKSLGVVRERLEELFGKNGLTRYERLLALEDARRSEAAKVIDHE